jgi:hypothetical protein
MKAEKQQKLMVSIAKYGINIQNKDPFRSKIIKIREPNRKPKISFHYTPLLSKVDAKKLSRIKHYEEIKCLDLFRFINEMYGSMIGSYYAYSNDAFDIPERIEISNLRKRVIDAAEQIINHFETNEVKGSILDFAAKIFDDPDFDIHHQVETAAQIQYNLQVKAAKTILGVPSTLREQMLLLRHFGLLKCIFDLKLSHEKEAQLLATLLNSSADNIVHYISATRYFELYINDPSDYRKKVPAKNKLHRNFNIFTPANFSSLNKVLAALGMEPV